MELGEIFHILQKRWWIIVIAVALTTGSALLFGELARPEYTATAEVVIEPSRPDLGLATAAKQLLRSYMTIADSRKWAEEVISELELPFTPEVLLSQVNFAAQDDRMVITVEVEDYDPTQAASIAKAWAEKLKTWRDTQNAPLRQEDRVSAYLRDEPLASKTSPPSRLILGIAGLLLGVIFSGVAILIIEFLEAGIYQTPQEIETKLGLSVLGAIPRSK